MTDLEAIDVNFAGGCSCRSDVVGCALHADRPASADVLVEEPLFYPHDHAEAPVPPPAKRRRWNEAIPTAYAGVNFRSRLEARWAAFFDLVSWPWQYEPLDLEGYIPDFILGFHRPLLVEVKPIVEWPPNDAVMTQLRKVQTSGWEHEAIVVGAYPVTTGPSGFSLGRFLMEHVPAEGIEESCSVVEPFCCRLCGEISFSSTLNDRCRAMGCSDLSHRDHNAGALVVVQRWREAGNRVQWRRRA